LMFDTSVAFVHSRRVCRGFNRLNATAARRTLV